MLGLQVPPVALRVEPTLGVPETTGADTFCSRTSVKCTKPLGHPLDVRVTRVHEKSPFQLSWDTMISSAETTFSTYATWPAEPAGFTPALHQAMAPTLGVPLVIRLIEVPQ